MITPTQQKNASPLEPKDAELPPMVDKKNRLTTMLQQNLLRRKAQKELQKEKK